MDDFRPYKRYRNYLIGGTVAALYTAVVFHDPEYAGELPPLAPTAPMAEPVITVASSASSMDFFKAL